MTREYFQLSQPDSNQIRGGIEEDYVGDAVSSKDYSYALEPKDYTLYGDSGFMVDNDARPRDYADNSFFSDLTEKSMWEEALENNNYLAMSDYNRIENLGEELEIVEECDDQLQTWDGSYWQFAYKDLNATNDCMCYYTNQKYPDYLPGFKCFSVEKNRPYK